MFTGSLTAAWLTQAGATGSLTDPSGDGGGSYEGGRHERNMR